MAHLGYSALTYVTTKWYSQRCSFCPCFKTKTGAHTASQTMGTRISYSPRERPERESDQSSPLTVEINRDVGPTSTPQFVFMSWRLIKHTDNFTMPIERVGGIHKQG